MTIQLRSTFLAAVVGLLLLFTVSVPARAQTEPVNKPAAVQPTMTPDEQRKAEAAKFADEEIEKLATASISIVSEHASGVVMAGRSSDEGEQPQYERAGARIKIVPPVAEAAELIAKSRKFATEVSDGTEAANVKLRDAVRSMNGAEVTNKAPSRHGKAFDPAEMLTAINEMVSKVHDIEQRWIRGEITEDERDLEQGVAVAKMVGHYGGKAIGGIIGIYIATMAPTSAAPIIPVAGGVGGSRIGETTGEYIARSCVNATRAMARGVRRAWRVVCGRGDRVLHCLPF